jgi:hypothetical protein
MAKKNIRAKVAPTRSTATQRSAGVGTLWIVGREEIAKDEDQFLGSEIIKLSDYLYEKEVKTATVRKNMERFLLQVGEIVASAPEIFGGYVLHEIEFGAEVTLKGELKLWGFGGAEVGGKAGIKFRVRRVSSDGK